MSWFDFIVLILSSFRLTRLIVFDEITAVLRKPFLEISYQTNEAGQLVRNVDIKGSGWRYRIGLLLSCYWCVGIWSTILLFSFYVWIPLSFPLHIILAIAGAAALIESKLYVE
ncbi:DUF1360 domain-containing protein [Thermoactinomyces sp. DSM 45892]|uniref:DUF1360 domain-containing protein n=1 Tax=Thermoactinomyces sp. DSM 45892 TaxID=1882753 RepID=UPI003517B42B